MITSRLGARVIDFGVLLILARLVAPADFGLIAIALSLITIIDMTLEVPLAQALVAMREPEDAHFSTALTIGLLRAIFLGGLFYAISFPIAALYNDPRLAPLIAVLGVSPAARSLFSPGMARQMRMMNFNPMFTAQIGAKLIAALITGAVLYAGGDYWAVVANNVAGAAMATVLSFILAPMRFALTLKHWRAFANVAGWFSVSQIIAALSWQLDRLLMGFSVPKAVLGQYTMASDVSLLPVQSLIAPAMQPIMSAMAQVQDDTDRRARAFLFGARAVMMVAMPVFVMFAMTAEWIVPILMGLHWEQADDYLSGLAVTIFAVAYGQLATALAMSMNRVRAVFNLQLVSLGSLLLFLPGGLHFFAIEGVVAARAISSIVALLGMHFIVRSLIGIGVIAQMKNLLPVLASGLLMAGAVWLARSVFETYPQFMILELLGMSAVGSVVFLAAMWVMGGLPDFRAFLKRGQPATP